MEKSDQKVKVGKLSKKGRSTRRTAHPSWEEDGPSGSVEVSQVDAQPGLDLRQNKEGDGPSLVRTGRPVCVAWELKDENARGMPFGCSPSHTHKPALSLCPILIKFQAKIHPTKGMPDLHVWYLNSSSYLPHFDLIIVMVNEGIRIESL
jgi:hypothetical protein